MSEYELMELHKVLTNRHNKIVNPTIETPEGT